MISSDKATFIKYCCLLLSALALAYQNIKIRALSTQLKVSSDNKPSDYGLW